MSSIDHSTPPSVRTLDQPTPVWIDVRKLLKPPPSHLYEQTPSGVQTHEEVVGLVHEWIRSADGSWLALVSYQLLTADEQWQTVVRHYVPAHLCRQRGVSRKGSER